MKCYLCNYDHVDVHDTDYTYGTYCQQCGATTEIKRTHPRRPADIKPLPVKPANSSRDSGKIVQLPNRKAKQRSGR